MSGELPSELGRLTKLERLIPCELGDLTKLTRLRLGANQFTGCIPEGLQPVPDNDLSALGLPFCSDR